MDVKDVDIIKILINMNAKKANKKRVNMIIHWLIYILTLIIHSKNKSFYGCIQHTSIKKIIDMNVLNV